MPPVAKESEGVIGVANSDDQADEAAAPLNHAFWSSRRVAQYPTRWNRSESIWEIRRRLPSLYPLRVPDEEKAKTLPLSTSSQNLDRLIGGGIRKGQVYDFFGASGTGKTQICFQLCVNQALLTEDGGTPVFVDTIGTFRPERVSELAAFRGGRSKEVLERILVLRCSSTADQLGTPSKVKVLCRQTRVGLLLLDSLTGNFVFELMGEKRILERQSGLARHLHDLCLLALSEDIPIVLTNEIRGRVSEGRMIEVELGSRTVSAAVHTRVHLSRLKERWRAVRVQPSPHPVETASFIVDERGVHD